MNEALDVSIRDYEGPLDLLVHLVYKNEMNIFDVPLTEITGHFIAEIKKMRDTDMEVAAEFINMASYLVYLKSRMLLPSDNSAEDEPDPEEEKFRLNQLLVEYSFYKDTALGLKAREKESARFLSRSESTVILKEETRSEDVYKLAENFFGLSVPKSGGEMVVRNSRIATEEVASRVKSFVLSREKTLWSEIAAFCGEKIESCVSFGAVLEMIKRKKITAFQEANFAEILLRLIREAVDKNVGSK